MRHKNRTAKLGRNSSHRRCLFANMLKSLIYHGRIETTVAKAKRLRSYADRMVTLAKKNSLASRRQAIAELMICYNTLTPKQARQVKEGNTSSYNVDRQVIDILFGELNERFAGRNGGYTRIVRTGTRKGDQAESCIIEYIEG